MSRENEYLDLADFRVRIVLKYEEVLKSRNNLSVDNLHLWEDELIKTREVFSALEVEIRQKREELVKNNLLNKGY
jgi:tRNA-binding EMAP/Myf-like protein